MVFGGAIAPILGVTGVVTPNLSAPGYLGRYLFQREKLAKLS